MYADQVEAQSSRSVKDRLHGDFASDSGRRRPISGKRHREDDDKWEHDLFDDNASQASNRRVGERDLRAKLQRKSTQSIRGSVSGSWRDLREQISSTLQPIPVRPKQAPEVSKPTRKSFIVQDHMPETKVQQKDETVESFLQSLGLEKYSITFQAEEVDMTALLHMTDEDLKALGIPLGPRKKICLALQSE